jgi:hypothetical protein
MLISIVCVFAASLFLFGKYRSPVLAPSSEPDHIYRNEVQGHDPEPFNQNLRAYFGTYAGAFVRGWPSKGGVYIFSARDTVELEFLKLEHLSETQRSHDSTEEDAKAWSNLVAT